MRQIKRGWGRAEAEVSIAAGLAAAAGLERTNLISLTAWTGHRMRGQTDGHGGATQHRKEKKDDGRTQKP